MALSTTCACTGPSWCRQRWVTDSAYRHHDTSARWANALGFSAGSVRVPKPVRLGHHQVQNRKQCGSHLPEHGSSFHLREHRTTQELLQVPGRIDPTNHSSLLAPTSVKGAQVVLYKLCKPALVAYIYKYCPFKLLFCGIYFLNIC